MIRLALALSLLAPAAAYAQHDEALNCGPRAAIVFNLISKFGERPQNIHTPNGRAPREFFANKRTGTWTVLQSRIGGQACMIGHGRRKPKAAPERKGGNNS